MRETRVPSLGWEDLLEKEAATHFTSLTWKIPWAEEPGGLQSVGSQRVRHNWVISLSFAFYKDWKTKAIFKCTFTKNSFVCRCVCVCVYNFLGRFSWKRVCFQLGLHLRWGYGHAADKLCLDYSRRLTGTGDEKETVKTLWGRRFKLPLNSNSFFFF